MISTYNFNHNQDAAFISNHLKKSDKNYAQSLSAIGSGLKVENAIDNPADFVLGESVKTQRGGINQSLNNIERNINFMQTADSLLEEYNTHLLNLKKLAIEAANSAGNSQSSLAVMQKERELILNKLDWIAQNGVELKQDAFSGGGSVTAEFSGNTIEFITADASVQSSSKEGYPVIISQLPSQAVIKGTIELDQDLISAGEELIFTEGGKTLKYITQPTDKFSKVVEKLNELLEARDIPLYLLDDEETLKQEVLIVHHKEYGSNPEFKISSSTAGVLAKDPFVFKTSKQGDDIAGTIDSIPFQGEGSTILTDDIESHVQGLQLHYKGEVDGNQGRLVKDFKAGNLLVMNNALQFHNQENHGKDTSFALIDISPVVLANNIENKSGLKSLNDINFKDFDHANDSIELIQNAIEQITLFRGKIGSAQKNQFESRKQAQDSRLTNIIQIQSKIADADMAQEISELTTFDIQRDVSTSLLAQANQKSSSVLTLLN